MVGVYDEDQWEKGKPHCVRGVESRAPLQLGYIQPRDRTFPLFDLTPLSISPSALTLHLAFSHCHSHMNWAHCKYISNVPLQWPRTIRRRVLVSFPCVSVLFFLPQDRSTLYLYSHRSLAPPLAGLSIDVLATTIHCWLHSMT